LIERWEVGRCLGKGFGSDVLGRKVLEALMSVGSFSGLFKEKKN
jgi:hypothetical protein